MTGKKQCCYQFFVHVFKIFTIMGLYLSRLVHFLSHLVPQGIRGVSECECECVCVCVCEREFQLLASFAFTCISFNPHSSLIGTYDLPLRMGRTSPVGRSKGGITQPRFSQYLFCTHYMPDPMLGSRDSRVASLAHRTEGGGGSLGVE